MKTVYAGGTGAGYFMKHAENHLNELFFRQILNSALQGIVVYGADMRYLVWNPFMERLSGKMASEVLGKLPLEVFPFLEEAGVFERIQLTLKGEVPAPIDFPFSLPDTGKSGWATDSCFPLYDVHGKVMGVIGIVQETTARHQAEHEIKASEMRYRRFIETSQEGFGELDSERKIVSVNARFEAMFGYGPGEMMGLPVSRILFPEDQARHFQQLAERFQGQSGSYEQRFMKKDGQELWVIVSGTPVKDNQGAVIGTFAMMTDITRRKEAEKQLFLLNQNLDQQVNEKSAKLIHSSKLASLGEMAAGVAHEINNPLSVIYGLANRLNYQLKTGKYDERYFEESLKKIEVTAKRIAAIISGLKSFSRDIGDEAPVKHSVKDVFESAFSLCTERFKARGIRLQLPVWDDSSLMCNSVQISQVVVNLLNNSFSAIESLSEKWIKIEVGVLEGERLQIRFVDSGHGIPDDVVQKMMMPFFTTKPVGSGTGLGLSISQGIIEKHGGRLYYDPSSANTCFVIELPKV